MKTLVLCFEKSTFGAIVSLSGRVSNLLVIGGNIAGRVVHPSHNGSALFLQNQSNLKFPPINRVAQNCLFSGGIVSVIVVGTKCARGKRKIYL